MPTPFHICHLFNLNAVYAVHHLKLMKMSTKKTSVFIRLTLEYVAMAWNPYDQYNIDTLEKSSKNCSITIVPGLRNKFG